MAATLAQLGEERNRLLSRVQQVLEADGRVTAAWLSGSYGRGEADAWSDLDLHVAVVDEHFEAFIAEHQTLFANCGQQLHVISHGILSWSMPNGRFWLVQYAPYMLEVDWNIGPTAATTRPEASYMLFDRVGIPITAPLPPVGDDFRRAEAKNQLDFFWAMAPIAIKFAGRGHTRLAVKQVDYLEGAFVKLWRALWRPELLQKDAYHQNRPLEAELDARLPRFGPTIDPLVALHVIRAHCDEVASWHPALAALGVSVHDGVVREVVALTEVAEKSARLGGSNPDQGSRR
ncbi:MAG: nucleotidyltransferase domain-containing protein [Caldilineaceae bacterium]|nr:nucleotidyltransferase domain-containing protein [Caldilineaceae bacterium]